MLATISDRLKVFEFLGSQLNLVSQKDGFNGKLNTVSWNHTNQVVAVAGTARVIHLVQASNGQFLSEVPFSSVQERAILHSDTHIIDDITSISFSNSSRYLASSSGNSVHIWDLKRRNLRVHKKIGTSIISSLLFLSDGTKVITGNQKGNLDIWDFEQSSDVTGLVTTEFTPRGITSMDIISGSQTKLGCGYDDGSISVFIQ
jgi:WD40 repeat protein